MRLIIALFILIVSSSMASAATYYVRTDGGTGTQCTGLTDAAYPGSGTAQACAFNHPNWPLPLYGQPTTYQAAAGDTIVIKAGSYKIGCYDADCLEPDVNITTDATCDEFYTYDCKGGEVNDNITIIGCSASGCSGGTRPELWGSGGSQYILNLSNSTGVTVKDLVITDHAALGHNRHSGIRCSSGVSSLNATVGILWSFASSLTIENVDTTGLCEYGMQGGPITDLTLRNVLTQGNGNGGINFDTPVCNNDGSCDARGDIVFDNVRVLWNGCVEDYPVPVSGVPVIDGSCTSQDQGGYGDGFGMSYGGANFTITDSNFSYNTSDGLDLLYHTDAHGIYTYTFGDIIIKRSIFEGNAGNPLKTSNHAHLEDNFIVGNCGFFRGQSFTATLDSGDNSVGFNNCRAAGNAIEVDFKDDESPYYINNTITSNGDVVLATTGTCTATTPIYFYNNIVLGGREFNDDTAYNGSGGNDSVSIFYNAEGGCSATFTEDYNICTGDFKEAAPCPGTNSDDSSAHPFSGTILQGPDSSPGYFTDVDYYLELSLASSSIAQDAADETVTGADALDVYSVNRGASWDIGAAESIVTTGNTVTFDMANSEDFLYVNSSSQSFTVTFSGHSTSSTYTIDYVVKDYGGSTVTSGTGIAVSSGVATIPLSVSQIGWFKVDLTVKENGTTVDAYNGDIASENGDNIYFTFGNIRTAPTQTQLSSRYGICEQTIPDEATPNNIQKLGIKWQRVDTRPHSQYPAADTYVWTTYDGWRTTALAHGYDLWALIAYGLSGSLSTKPLEAQEERWMPVLSHWENYIRAFVQHYGFKYYEIWNEAHGGFWLDTDANFFDLFEATVGYILEEQPDAIIAMPGTNHPALSWYNSFRGDVAWNTGWQLINHHPYTGQSRPEDFYFGSPMFNMRHINSDPVNRETIITEIGWSTYDGEQTYEEQAQWTIRAMAMYLALGVQKYFPYEYKNPGISDGLTQNTSDRENNFGLFLYDHEPKPSAIAYANFIYRVNDKPGFKLVTDRDDIYQAYFSDGNETVVVVWTTETSRTATVNVGSDVTSVTVSDFMGVESSGVASNGQYSLTVTQDPKYVIYSGRPPFSTTYQGVTIQ